MDAAALAEFPCALCGADAPEPRFEKRRFRYVSCGSCGLVYVSPRYVDPAVANSPMQHPRDEYADESDARLEARRRKYARRLRQLAPYRGSGRLLEIGCREGHFLSVASQLGWSVEGVEPEAATAAVARERFGLTVHQAYLADADLADACYDVVYLCEVIEHVADPLPLLREVHRLLRPGGVVYVKTGNVASWSATINGPDWSYYAYARLGHVTYFAPPTLRRLYSATGFEPLGVRTWGIELPRGPRRSLARPFARWLGRGGHMEGLGRKP